MTTGLMRRLDTLPRDAILLLDEEVVAFAINTQLLHKINKLGFRCILITRNRLGSGIPYSYKAVYRLEMGKDNVYRTVRYYKDYDVLPKANKYLTEDTGSGHYYYTKFLQNVVKPSYKMALHEEAAKLNACLIADGIAYGSTLQQALGVGVDLFLPESFEYLIGSKLFGKDTMFNYTYEDMIKNSHSTEEKCITRIFREQCRTLNPPINYDKTVESIKDTIIMDTNVFETDHHGITENMAKRHNIDFNDEEACRKLAEELGY